MIVLKGYKLLGSDQIRKEGLLENDHLAQISPSFYLCKH